MDKINNFNLIYRIYSLIRNHRRLFLPVHPHGQWSLESHMAGVFKLLDGILLSEDVKVDEGICGLEWDSEVTHLHGSDVMEEVRA